MQIIVPEVESSGDEEDHVDSDEEQAEDEERSETKIFVTEVILDALF